MSLYEIFNYNVGIKYKNTLCSKATYFVVITTIIAVVFPLIISYRSKGFWLKNYVFYEQPDVRFKYQYLIIAETDEIDFVISCGNLPNISKLIQNGEDCFFMKIREEDYNFDNKIDEIKLQVKINNPLMKRIYSVKIFLLFNYKLNDICPLEMESLILYEKSSGLASSGLLISGNMHLTQVTALPCRPNNKDTNYNTSVLPNSDDVNVENWLETVLYAYSRRYASTRLTDVYALNKYGSSNVFDIKMSIAVTENAIRYRPGLWQELKHSWQQYLSIAVIFYWILIKIKAYVFRKRVLPAWESTPWKKLL